MLESIELGDSYMLGPIRSCTVAALSAVFLSAGVHAAKLPDCLANPGIPDLEGFTHRIQVRLNGSFWYLLAPELQLPTTPAQAGQSQDLPGHCWKLGFPIGNKPRLFGKHFNTGPLAGGSAPRFWSSTAGSHQQLFWVDLVVSRWSPRIALEMAQGGYVHYHELIKVGEGCVHPRLVAWFRHSAIEKFSFDGGPPPVLPSGTLFRPRNVPHDVQPGIDHNFPPNYDIPYKPESQRQGDPFLLPVCSAGD